MKTENRKTTILTIVVVILWIVTIFAIGTCQGQYVITPSDGKPPLILHGVPSGTGSPLVWSGDTVKVGSPFIEPPITSVYIFSGDIKQDERCLIANGHADEQCRYCNWLETKAYIPDTCILKRIWWICEDFTDIEPPNFYLINNGVPFLFGITGTQGQITTDPFMFTIYPGTLQLKFVEGTKPNKAIFLVELWR